MSELTRLLAVAVGIGEGMRFAPEPLQPRGKRGTAAKAADLRKRKAASKARVKQRLLAKGKRR